MGDIHDDRDCATLPENTVCSLKGSFNTTEMYKESLLCKSDSYSRETCELEPTGVSAGNCTSMSAGQLGESSLAAGQSGEESSLALGQLKESSLGGLTKSSRKGAQNPTIASVYRQDVIQHASEEGVFGLVTKVAGDSDSDSDNEDQDDAESLSGDHARVIWSNLSETNEKIEDLVVVDRSFLHGDIVAAVSDPKGQTGTVVNVEILVDLKTATGEIKPNVSSRKLRPIRAFAEGDNVLHGPWLGRVVEVVDNVTVLFDDGSKCKIMRADPERLMPVSRSLLGDTDYAYYPGQPVRGSSSVVFKNARWLRGTWKASRMEGTVSNVEVGSVYVYWIVAANPGPNSKSTTIPADMQDPKQLRLLSCFSYANWQLGDWCLLPISERRSLGITATAKQDIALDRNTDILVGNNTLPALDSCAPMISESAGNDTMSILDPFIPAGSCSKPPIPDNWVLHRKKYRKRRVRRDKKILKKEDILERALLVLNTKTKVDILWQDGTTSFGIDSKVLFHVDNLGEHDFWPEQYVLEKGSDEDGEDPESKLVGVVKSVNSKERTAIVRWLKSMLQPEDPREFDKEEVVSVYELIEHPDYNYCIGDIVIRLPSVAELSEVSGVVESSVDDKVCPNISQLENCIKTENESKLEKECEMEPKPDCIRIELSSEQRSLRKRQKAKAGVAFEDQSGDDKEIELKPKCVNEAKSTEPIFRQGSSRKCKAKVGMNTEESDLSSIGNIIGLKDGDIEVMWADGTISKVGPQTIFVVGREDDMESSQSSFHDGDEDGDDAASWETVDDNTRDAFEADKEVVEDIPNPISTDGNHDMETLPSVENLNDCSNGGMSIPRAAFGFVARLATGLLGFRGSKSLSNTMDESSQEQTTLQNGLEQNTDGTEMSNAECKQLTRDSKCHQLEHIEDGLTAMPVASEVTDSKNRLECSGHINEEDVQSFQDRVQVSTGEYSTGSMPTRMKLNSDQMHNLSVSGKDDQFKHFDSVKDPLDHYFLNETAQSSNDRKWSKKVQQEWSILEKNLPDMIYVRVYEDRMDLLRAVILGASGSPYQDGLFFFDIYLPSDYPQAPPAVYYHSHGLKLNPNLYETGKVCLSLLNTWTGRGNEIWDPKISSILQVLISLQGLVLNARPYFNEAGYDKQIGTAEGEKNSLAYNENSFLLTCKLMLYLLHRPPQHFESFVKDHFRRCSHSILAACDAYMKGAEVGSLSEVPLNSDSVSENNSSVGFRLMLAKVMPKLQSAFNELGRDDHQSLQTTLNELEDTEHTES